MCWFAPVILRSDSWWMVGAVPKLSPFFMLLDVSALCLFPCPQNLSCHPATLLSAAFHSCHHCLGVMVDVGLIWSLGEHVNFKEDNDFWGA